MGRKPLTQEKAKMKKADFLNAVKGRTVRVEWIAGVAPIEKGLYECKGLPEECKGVHPNQARAWLIESFTPELEQHPGYHEEQERLHHMMNAEDYGAIVDSQIVESQDWAQAFSDHPTMVFHC